MERGTSSELVATLPRPALATSTPPALFAIMLPKETAMSTVTLSLAEPAARWLDEQVATGRYANADAYLAELVERDRVEAESTPR